MRVIPRKHTPTVRREVLGNYWAGIYEMVIALGVFGAVQHVGTHLMVGDHDPWHLPDLSNIDFGAEMVADTYWTDVFVYLIDEPEVEEGAILSFFSDINPENTNRTICF